MTDHVHAWVQRDRPEDYAYDCACGEAGCAFNGKIDPRPDMRRSAPPPPKRRRKY